MISSAFLKLYCCVNSFIWNQSIIAQTPNPPAVSSFNNPMFVCPITNLSTPKTFVRIETAKFTFGLTK
jgi:hypothetical protein